MKKGRPAILEPARERIQLRIKDRGDLHGYLFTDRDHAVKWLNQGFVAKHPDLYSIAIVMAKDTICGADRIVKVVRKMKVAEFLKEFTK